MTTTNTHVRYCGFAGQSGREIGECDLGYDHDEHRKAISCPNTECAEHHGDTCYSVTELRALGITVTIS